ncbi:hypothetical protein [Ligilactobacillus murinus]|uniref:hypothetical protein n=1 Tax=Ligilactobacillus murinus TaxID=1622 RepID=UPI00144174D4|nr:hypothetical protein [Ligilactobacillus murinus]
MDKRKFGKIYISFLLFMITLKTLLFPGPISTGTLVALILWSTFMIKLTPTEKN